MQQEFAKNHSESDWRWKLRLFASADLVGSTAFKATQAASRTPDWSATFREFFRDFPVFLKEQYSQIPQPMRAPEILLEPWKFLGDEILFVAELKCCHDALSHIQALRNAISGFPRHQWHKEKDNAIPLNVKAAAWLAGFPVSNTEITINGIDFIGPAIDLGFRIAKYAEPRKLILSADLALLLLDAIHDLEVSRADFRLGFSGREVLKGVIGNEPYPILWLGIPDQTFFLEEELLRTPCDPGKLTDYLRRYLDATPKLMRPFIEGDRHPKYNEIPMEFIKLRDQMRSEEKLRDFEETQNQPEPPTSGPAKEMIEPQPPTEQ